MKTLTYMVLGSGDQLPKTMTLDEDGVAYHFLILATRGGFLYRIAMLVYETMLPRDCLFNPMEGQNKEQFQQFLPDKYKDCDIVDIKNLDSVVIIEPLEIRANATPKEANKTLGSIFDVPCHCDKCGWGGTVDSCEPDVDGDGSLGCPDCLSVVTCEIANATK